MSLLLMNCSTVNVATEKSFVSVKYDMIRHIILACVAGVGWAEVAHDRRAVSPPAPSLSGPEPCLNRPPATPLSSPSEPPLGSPNTSYS
jgi:hypothetical protein